LQPEIESNEYSSTRRSPNRNRVIRLFDAASLSIYAPLTIS